MRRRSAQPGAAGSSSTPAAAISSRARCPSPARQVHRPDPIDEDGRRETELDRVERRRLDAVVRRQAAHDDSLDAAAARRIGASSVGVVAPVAGSRIVKPE